MGENRLLEVAGHWLPRMEVAGLPSSLAKAVMDDAGEWPNWCMAFSAAGAGAEAAAAAAEAAGHSVTAGEAYARAALLYHFGQFMFFDDLEQKAAATARKLAAFRRAAPLLDPPVDLIAVPFEGGHLMASRRVPEGGAHGTVVIVPGSDSTKEEFPALEAHFLRRGLATLSLDGPGQGEGRAFGPLRPDITDALAAVISRLEALGDRSPKAVAGMAFGGHLALRAAAGLEAVAAAVSINGFHDLGRMWPAFPPVYRDNMRYALGAGSPQEAEARAKAFTLDGVAARGTPVLVLHGGLDRIFPADQAAAQAEWAGPAARLELFANGNHVCNNIPFLYRPLVADWLADRLAARVPQGACR